MVSNATTLCPAGVLAPLLLGVLVEVLEGLIAVLLLLVPLSCLARATNASKLLELLSSALAAKTIPAPQCDEGFCYPASEINMTGRKIKHTVWRQYAQMGVVSLTVIV